MGLLSNVTTGAVKWASGFNWYKLGAEAIVVLCLLGGTYGLAVHNCEIKHERAKTTAALNKVASIQKDVARRVPEVQSIDKAAAKRNQQVKQTGDKLNESLAKSGDAVGCHFTDDQLQQFRKLSEATR